MQEIGGYFELELKVGEHYHKNALRLNTARNCFEYIIRSKKYSKIFIPYFTCDTILEPLKKLEVEYEFYRINELLEPIKKVKLKSNEAFLYTNYFGLKQETVKELALVYKKQLIVDNAQAFYAEPIKDIDTFYSARKFFGVSDGAYLYTDIEIDITEKDFSFDRMSHLLKRIDLGAKEGYKDFQLNEQSLAGQPIKKMSNLTESILSSIDYKSIKEQRIKNYNFYENLLGHKNEIQLKLKDNDVPMIYLYKNNDRALKEKLLKNNIFTASYWPNVLVWTNPLEVEYELTTKTIFLPVDQRCSLNDIRNISLILKDK